MCGIAGILRNARGGGVPVGLITARMTAALTHRGPDASDVWTDEAAGISLGHRRLSILDLSAAGAQPMRSECGRFAVTFNGEIYNHLDIRGQLEACSAAPNWRGHSDTETLLYAVRQWGIAEALQRFIGMFAFALWDARERTLTLARDRFGEKPLFYGWCGGDLLFGSELKALAIHPEWSPTLDRAALTAFIRHAYVPVPATIWTGIRKLPPASFAGFRSGDVPGTMPAAIPYWRFREQVVAAQGMRIRDEGEALEELQRLLSIAIKRQCLSDVPLGAFLSGGIDSSTVVALMQAQATQPVRTFTIGFREGAYDEANDAKKIAEHLGTDHTELYVDPKTAMDVVSTLPLMYDEPFADSSQIPTHLVSVLAREHVTVALSGDGGDELFGGYNRHVWAGKLNARFGDWPAPLKRALSALLGAVSPEPADTFARLAQPLLPSHYNVRRAGDQVKKLARVIGASSFDHMYQLLCSIDAEPQQTVLGGREVPSWSMDQMHDLASALDPLDRMTLADSLSYMTDDILQKVDRAAMAVGLETRVPFLDKDVAEFAARVPPHMKVRAGRGKWLVRQVLYRHVPSEFVDRPKMGFSIPIDDWLRGPLKAWAGDLLSPGRLKLQYLFNADLVERRFDDHVKGRQSHGHWLWSVLMAQAWCDAWCGPGRLGKATGV